MGQAVKEEDRTSCCCFHLFPGSRLEVCFEYIFVIIARTMIVMAPSKKKSRDSSLISRWLRGQGLLGRIPPSPSFGKPVVLAPLPRDELRSPSPLSVGILQAAPREDQSDMHAQLEALHGVVKRLSSTGALSADRKSIWLA